MENTLEKMSIDTENKQATIQYTSELQQQQQQIQQTMHIASPMIATTTNTNTIITADTPISADTSAQQQQHQHQQRPYSSTMNPFVFFSHDISLFQPLDLFDKESSLDQLFTQHNATTSSLPSSSSSTATSTPSPAMNHLPTSLLDDSLLDDMLTQTLSSPTNPFFHLDDTEFTSIATTATNDTTRNYAATGPSQRLSNATHDGVSITNTSATTPTTAATAPTSVKRTIRKKPSPPGQATMPIRVCSKSTRPPRHIECYNCHATKSPLWRRTPDRKETLCNACGLYYRQYKSHRAIQSRSKSSLGRNNNNNEFSIKVSGLSESCTDFTTTHRHKKEEDDDNDDDQPVKCVNCHQTKTPLWRKNKHGESVCNACGLYSRLHHRDRPVKMRKTTIQRRRRDYWNTDEETTTTSAMVSTFSLQEPCLSPTTSMASSPDSTTMDDITMTTMPPPTMTTTSDASPKSILNFGEDTRFASLLAQMDRSQMQGFLGMLEQRCDVVRTLLDLSGNGSG
ncbi:unnamed protein product [Absidia cylindrospora]